MRVPVFLAFSYFVVTVWAAGYAGCLERLWLFRAYEIDALNNEADQTIGYKCQKWIEDKKECENDRWNACKPHRKGETRCNYGELIWHLGSTDGNPRGWDVFNDDNSLNIEETGKKCMERYSKSRKKGTVYNFPGYNAIKGGAKEYVFTLNKIGETVTKTRNSKKTAANEKLFAAFDDMTERIITARAGDHGKFAIEAAETALKGAENVVKRDLGPDPLSDKTPPEHWYSVDWEETKNKAKAKNDEDLLKRIDQHYEARYGEKGNKSARDHQAVVNAFKQMKDNTAKSQCT